MTLQWSFNSFTAEAPIIEKPVHSFAVQIIGLVSLYRNYTSFSIRPEINPMTTSVAVYCFNPLRSDVHSLGSGVHQKVIHT